ncbi:MAG: MHYT domain-containing protein [Granulosicoccus sp.]
MAALMMVTHTHNTPLILVAIVVAIVAAFTGLALTRKISELPDSRRKSLVTMAALVIGGGIWTMHFVAMLATEYSVPVAYDLVWTLASGLISILVVGMALLLLHYARRTPRVLNAAGLIVSAGIVAMHYIGMSAMRGATPQYSIGPIIMALCVAAITCLLAIRIAYGNRSKQNIIAGGLLLGTSVTVVHYSAMLGTQYIVSDIGSSLTIAMDNSTLAVLLVLSAFVICGSFLLVSATFLTVKEPVNSESMRSATVAPPATAEQILARPDSTAADQSDGGTSEQRVPLQSVSAERLQANDQVLQKERLTASAADKPEPEIRIPYERNKKVQFVTSADVGAIRADGRYTHLYTQSDVLFCPWSITEAEKRLVGLPFYRTHRSYLVNLDNMASYEKRKESGVCKFLGYEKLTKVPVSRTRVAGLLELIGLA